MEGAREGGGWFGVAGGVAGRCVIGLANGGVVVGGDGRHSICRRNPSDAARGLFAVSPVVVSGRCHSIRLDPAPFRRFTEFYRKLLDVTEFYRVLPSFTEFYLVLPSFT